MKEKIKNIVIHILTAEAKWALRKYAPTVIAVTGSVGKTTTKDAIACVLSEGKPAGSIRASKKSMNSEIGLPLTILGLENAWSSPIGWTLNILRGLARCLFSLRYPKTLILEVGADHPGDIKRAAAWLRPTLAVVTRLPDMPVHVEYFPNPDMVRKEKGYLVEYMRKNGVFVGNADDPEVSALRGRTTARFLSYGFGEDAVVRATRIHVLYEDESGRHVPKGMLFRVDHDGGSFPVRIHGVLGLQVISAALAALAVGLARGESMVEMTEALEHFSGPRGRMRILPGRNNAIIIDDSYNSSPVAAHAALETLEGLAVSGRKIAIFGDMLELGEYSAREHEELGAHAGKTLDLLLTVGKRARGIAEGAKQAGLKEDRIVSFDTSDEAGEWIRDKIKPGDTILAKGSQGSGANKIRLERAVKRILLNPEKAAELLVRQEQEWEWH